MLSLNFCKRRGLMRSMRGDLCDLVAFGDTSSGKCSYSLWSRNMLFESRFGSTRPIRIGSDQDGHEVRFVAEFGRHAEVVADEVLHPFSCLLRA